MPDKQFLRDKEGQARPRRRTLGGYTGIKGMIRGDAARALTLLFAWRDIALSNGHLCKEDREEREETSKTGATMTETEVAQRV